MAQLVADFIFILVLTSSGLLALAGLKTLLRDAAARRAAGTEARSETRSQDRGARPDGIDLLIDLVMVLTGVAGTAGALMGLGAF